MKLYAAIMLGGALGSAARFALSVWVAGRVGEEFPWGTFAVNVIGSFVIGFLAGLTGPDGPLMVPEVVRMFLLVGILGGFTTFSSFSLQTIMLLQDGQWLWAAGNVFLSVILCLLATAGGIALANVLPLKS
jgi:CrcB protein